jgi:hypothetical protein
MVYAVMMITIRNFEKAFGRRVIWQPVFGVDPKTKKFGQQYIDKLLVFPHGVRDQNAYYSPDRKVVVFGYYNTTPAKGSTYLPGGVFYSCLSHDIIAHETTHALLDSVHSLYMEVTHPDLAGFHEGFADIVALLQHFTYPEIVRNQIQAVKGRLDMENLLLKLAVEFGQSTGEAHSLRDAIGLSDENGKWIPRQPATTDYESNIECHDRGALLVAAVFDAFQAIYKNRTADLMRIASAGSGMLPEGDLHPDLVNRLAQEAAKTASHVLNICVRALDYCPPVDLNYGDYLRALITADKELVQDDEHHYRIAFINAFRKRGIFPAGVPNLSVDTLCYSLEGKAAILEKLKDNPVLRELKERLAYITDRKKIFEVTSDFISGGDGELATAEGVASGGNFYVRFFDWLQNALPDHLLEDLTGLVFSPQFKALRIKESRRLTGRPVFWMKSLQLNNRIGPDGTALNQLIITIVQTANIKLREEEDGELVFEEKAVRGDDRLRHDVRLRGGCTLIFDLNDLTLKHAIAKPIFDPSALGKGRGRKLKVNLERAKMQHRSMEGSLAEEIGVAPLGGDDTELFANFHNQPLFSL